MEEMGFEKIDYEMLLLNHLNRLSIASTSSLFQSYDKVTLEQVSNPPKLGDVAMTSGVSFLLALIPTEMRDETFNDNIKDFTLSKDYFHILKEIINLLDRIGYLRTKNISARRKSN